MNVDTTRNDLMPSQIQPGTQVKGAKSSGAAQPPRNMIDASAESRIMLAYSPRKNRANPFLNTPPCGRPRIRICLRPRPTDSGRSEGDKSELQSLMPNSYSGFWL